MFVVFFEDQSSAVDQRARHMKSHLAFLQQNAAVIRSAGPLQEAQSGTPAGGLWIVDCEDAQQVWDLVHTDPFWPTGLRKSVNVLQWNRVFADGNVSTKLGP